MPPARRAAVPATKPRTSGTLNPDDRWMGAALRAARAAARRGEIPVGAVAVRDGRLLASGGNRTVGGRDPSAHAEIVAIRRAARRSGNHRLNGTTLYVTLEPCPMCLGALVQARIDRLVYGAGDPKGGGTWLLDLPEFGRRSNHRFEVSGGIRAREAAEILRRFFARRREVRARRGGDGP